jgi:hypothetical protein
MIRVVIARTETSHVDELDSEKSNHCMFNFLEWTWQNCGTVIFIYTSRRETTNDCASRLLSIPPSVDSHSSVSSGESYGPLPLGATHQTSDEHSSCRNEPISFFEDNVDFPVSSTTSTIYDTQYNMLPVTDGRNIISYELQQICDPFGDRHRVLQTALYVMDQLTGRNDPMGELVATAQQGQSPWIVKTPSVEFLDCMLRGRFRLGLSTFGSSMKLTRVYA